MALMLNKLRDYLCPSVTQFITLEGKRTYWEYKDKNNKEEPMSSKNLPFLVVNNI